MCTSPIYSPAPCQCKAIASQSDDTWTGIFDEQNDVTDLNCEALSKERKYFQLKAPWNAKSLPITYTISFSLLSMTSFCSLSSLSVLTSQGASDDLKRSNWSVWALMHLFSVKFTNQKIVHLNINYTNAFKGAKKTNPCVSHRNVAFFVLLY